MPFVQPNNPHTRGQPGHVNTGNQGSGGNVIHLPPGGILPNQWDVAKSIIDYVDAHGCDGSQELHGLTVLFQAETNGLIQQDINRGITGEQMLPVDGNFTGPTLQAVSSIAGRLNIPFNGCKALAPPPPPKTGGTGPQPQQTAATSSSNLPLYIGLGLLGVTTVVMIAMASGGKKKKRGKR